MKHCYVDCEGIKAAKSTFKTELNSNIEMNIATLAKDDGNCIISPPLPNS